MKWTGLASILSLMIILGVFSCERIFWMNKETIRINHYRQSCGGVGAHLCYLAQKENKIGSFEWTYFSGVRGFNYEWGYVYDIEIKRKKMSDNIADAGEYSYKLIEVLDKQRAGPDEEFEIYLFLGPEPCVYGDTVEGFTLFDEMDIDCGDLCIDLSNMLDTAKLLTGVFKHKDEETIELMKLINN
ncbi:DUF4377 domain-containing protein [Bacteroidota bacterium]